MKKILFIVLVFLSFTSNYSQEIQIIDEIFESNGACRKSYRIRIINRDRKVNRIYVTIKASEALLEPRRRTFNDREYVRTLPDGGKVYETATISGDYGYNHHFIEIRGVYKRNFRVQTKWRRDFKQLRCNLENFKQYVLEPRGETLEEAIKNQCNNASPKTKLVNLLLPVELKEGKVYNIDFVGYSSSYYWNVKKVNNINENGNYADDRPVLSGPFSITCNDGGGDTTTNYDLKLAESDVFVYSNCVSCPGRLDLLNPRFLGGTFPINKHVMTTEGNTVQTQFTIRNSGSKPSVSTKLNFYLSDNYNSLVGVKANSKTITLPAIAAGAGFLANPVFTVNDFGRQPGRYYLVIQIESGSNDSNYENKIVSIPVEVKSAFGRNRISRVPLSKQPSLDEYAISVYTFNGLLRSTHLVRNKFEEAMIVEELPKGLFIIKNGKETYKVTN